MKLKNLLAGGVALCLVGSVCAAEMNEAEAESLYAAGDYCFSQFFESNGEAKEENKTQALEYYTLAAQYGLPKAANALSSLYGQGWGIVEQDLEESKKWHKIALQGRDMNAQHKEAYKAYTDNDHAKAVKYFLMAIKQGETHSSDWLRTMFHANIDEEIMYPLT